MRNVKVLIWGFGAMGSGIYRALASIEHIDVVGVIDQGSKVHQDANLLCGINDVPPLLIQDESILDTIKVDVAILATDSFVPNSFDKIKRCVEAGMHVLSSAEEMAYPKATHPKLFEQMDALAKKHEVSILGTGINPGFMMDALVIALSSVCVSIDSIEVIRRNSLSPFGYAVMEEQGVGLSKEQFNQRMAEGKLAGHVGFNESLHMIADALHLKLQRIEITNEPIISSVERQTPYAHVQKDHVAGCAMEAIGYVNDQPMIILRHPQQIEPSAEGIDTSDEIIIRGIPNVSMKISPEVDGGIGTIAMIVNSLPALLNAKHGCLSMIDLPLPRFLNRDILPYLHVEEIL